MNSNNWDAMLGISMVYMEMNDKTNSQIYFKKAEELEPRLKEGNDGLVKLEQEGYYYTDYEKQNINKLYNASK
jgi:hypothetical protein